MGEIACWQTIDIPGHDGTLIALCFQEHPSTA
jgi:hypothetical protein